MCWAGESQAASVVALTACELYRLSCESLHTMVKNWPELRTELGLKGALEQRALRGRICSAAPSAWN